MDHPDATSATSTSHAPNSSISTTVTTTLQSKIHGPLYFERSMAAAIATNRYTFIFIETTIAGLGPVLADRLVGNYRFAPFGDGVTGPRIARGQVSGLHHLVQFYDKTTTAREKIPTARIYLRKPHGQAGKLILGAHRCSPKGNGNLKGANLLDLVYVPGGELFEAVLSLTTVPSDLQAIYCASAKSRTLANWVPRYKGPMPT